MPETELCFSYYRPPGASNLAYTTIAEMAKALSRLVHERLNSRRRRGWNQTVEHEGETVRVTEEGVSLVEARLCHPDVVDRPDQNFWNRDRPQKLRVDLVAHDASLNVEFLADLKDAEPVLRRTANFLCWGSLETAARLRLRQPSWRYVVDPENTNLDPATLAALQKAAEKYCDPRKN